MTYFYDYFARGYRESRAGERFPDPAAMFQGMDLEAVESCRKVLKNAFTGYREGKNAGSLKKLAMEYREYVSCCHDVHAKDRYNAFVYRYMLEAPVGSRAMAAKLGVTKETVLNYVGRCIDEMLMLCMGMPALKDPPKDGEAVIRMLVNGSRLLASMAGDHVLGLFPGQRERMAVEQGRQLTRRIMG